MSLALYNKIRPRTILHASSTLVICAVRCQRRDDPPRAPLAAHLASVRPWFALEEHARFPFFRPGRSPRCLPHVYPRATSVSVTACNASPRFSLGLHILGGRTRVTLLKRAYIRCYMYIRCLGKSAKYFWFVSVAEKLILACYQRLV